MLRLLTGRPVMRGLVVISTLCALAVVGGVALINRGPLPMLLANKGIALIEKLYPVDVTLESVRFSGPLRLVLNDVTVEIPKQAGLTKPLHAEQVQLDFSLLSVLRGQHMAGLERVHVIAPQISADYRRYLQLVQPAERKSGAKSSKRTKPSGQVKQNKSIALPQVAIIVRDGFLKLEGKGAPGSVYFDLAAYGTQQSVRVTRMAVRRGGGQLLGNGLLRVDGELQAQINMTDWQVIDLLGWYPLLPISGRGALSAQAKIDGSVHNPRYSGQMSLDDARLVLPSAAQQQNIAVSQASVAFKGTTNGVEISALDVTTPTGQLTGKGTIDTSSLDVQLKARNLSLPTDIPWLSAWGIGGKADFNGKLTGTLAQPTLLGDVTIQKGRLWNQPVDRAKGHLSLSASQFVFNKVQVEKGRSRYLLKGELTDLDTPQQALQVSLDSQAGRVEDLLAVLAIPIDAKGQLDGLLTFGGPFTSIVTAGDVTVRDASVYGEQLDWAQGGFSWGNGELRLDNIQGRLGQGHLQVAGRAALDGSALQIDVDADRWPLEQVALLKELAPGWQGAVSWTGTLRGTATEPELAGELFAKELQLGKAKVSTLEGPLTFAEGDLETTGLVARTPEGGAWRLYGQVSEALTQPNFDMHLSVEDESLSALLAMGGLRIPAAIVDGAVHGTVTMQGPVDDPEARLQLRLAERGLAAQDSLRLDLLIADRRVSILRAGA